MLVLVKEVGSFFKAVLWKWWGLMSCALWTFAAVYGEMHSKPDAWYVQFSFGLAIVVVCISTFLAWREQYEKVGAQNRCLKEYEDRAVDLIWVSHAAWDGNSLSVTAPSEKADDKAILAWKDEVQSWLDRTRNVLFSLSPIAANKFFHIRKPSDQMHYGVHQSIWGDLSVSE